MLPVRADLELRLVLGGDRTATVPVQLQYSPDDPWAVTAVFGTADSGGSVTWVFGRELLDEGLSAPAGEGDVAVWPARTAEADLVYLSLASPSGSALLEGDLDDVRAFLDDSYAVVPSGAESLHLDLEPVLRRLVADPS